MATEVFTQETKAFRDKLWSLKNENKLCDAVIIINKQRIAVHSVVLASSSEFFENTFANTDLAAKEVTFKDIDKEILLSLLEYCYTGTIEITESNVNEIFVLASILSIASIVENSSRILQKTLKIDNCMSMWKTAKMGNSETLKNIVLEFIRKNFEKVSSQQELLTLDYSDINELLSKNIIAPEKNVYETIKKWVNYDTSRRDKLVGLLDFVKLEKLPYEFLLTESKFICSSNECFTKIINSALELAKKHNSNECLNSNNTLIAIGGYDVETSKSIEVFDVFRQEWIEVKYNECNRWSFATTLLNNKLILIGGSTKDSSQNAAVQYYDLKTGQTEELPSMKYVKWESTPVKFKEHVFVIGGFNGWKCLPYVEKWDPSSKAWTEVAQMSGPRTAHAAGVLGDEIIVTGGAIPTENLSTTEAYNPVSNTWRKCASMNEKRRDLGGATVGGYFYSVGGFNNGRLKSAERYDPKIDKWTMICSTEFSRQRIHAASYMKQLVIAGGESDGSRESRVEIYDENTNKWKIMPSLKKARHMHSLVEIPWNLAEFALSRKVSK